MIEIHYFVFAVVCAVLIWWYDDTRWRRRLNKAVSDKIRALDAAERKSSEYDSVIKAIVDGIEDFNSWHENKLTFRKVGGKWKLEYGEEQDTLLLT